jgi:hypothetical protein
LGVGVGHEQVSGVVQFQPVRPAESGGRAGAVGDAGDIRLADKVREPILLRVRHDGQKHAEREEQCCFHGLLLWYCESIPTFGVESAITMPLS